LRRTKFLLTIDYDSSDTSGTDDDEEVDATTTTTPLANYPTRPLKLAKDTNFFDVVGIAQGHQDAQFKTVAGAIYIRYHEVKDDFMTEYVLEDQIGKATKTALFEIHRERMKKWQYDWQRKAMEWFYKGMKKLVKIYGKDAWKAASTTQRKAVFRHLFSRDPIAMVKKMHPAVWRSIDLRGIYEANDEGRVKWQKWFRLKFIWTCQLFLDYRNLIKKKDRKEEAYREWRGFTRDIQIEEKLKLGDLYQLPIKQAGPLDRDRRDIITTTSRDPVRYNVDEDLADD
jgi:hypothetical protein